MQLTFRLIDFLTCSVIPFLAPDYFPSDPKEVQKRITESYKTVYTIELYQSKIHLKPNYLIENKLTLKTPLIKVQNKVFKTKARNLNALNEEFFVE